MKLSKEQKELYRRVERIVYEPSYYENHMGMLNRYIRLRYVPLEHKTIAKTLKSKTHPRPPEPGTVFISGWFDKLYVAFFEWFGSTFCRRHNHVETIVRGNHLPLWHCEGPRLGSRSLPWRC